MQKPRRDTHLRLRGAAHILTPQTALLFRGSVQAHFRTPPGVVYYAQADGDSPERSDRAVR